MFNKHLKDSLSKKVTDEIYKEYIEPDTIKNESVKPLIRAYIISLAMVVDYCEEQNIIEEVFNKLKDQKLDRDEFYKWIFNKAKDIVPFECGVLPVCLLKDLCCGDFSKVNTAGQAADILKEVCSTYETYGYESQEALQIVSKYSIDGDAAQCLMMDTIDGMPNNLDCNVVSLEGNIDTKKLTQIFQDNLENIALAAKKKLDTVNHVEPSNENRSENASWTERVAAVRKGKHVTFNPVSVQPIY